jgi:hypothetical protein
MSTRPVKIIRSAEEPRRRIRRGEMWLPETKGYKLAIEKYHDFAKDLRELALQHGLTEVEAIVRWGNNDPARIQYKAAVAEVLTVR